MPLVETWTDDDGRLYHLANDRAEAQISDQALETACSETGLNHPPAVVLDTLSDHLRRHGPMRGRSAILEAFDLTVDTPTPWPWTKIFKRLCAEGRVVRYKRGDPHRGPALFVHREQASSTRSH